MPFDPFRGNGDGSSLEQEDPIGGAVKQAAKAVNNQTQQQVKATNQSFVDLLYGNVSGGSESSDSPDNPTQSAQTPKPTPAAAQSTGLQGAANPSEQSQLDETRRKLAELQKLHNQNYFDATFGEEAQRKRQQEEEEEKQLKQQEEEEKQQEEKEKKARMEESLQAFSQGKGKGKGADQLGPVAVSQAKTKTESNRGTSG